MVNELSYLTAVGYVWDVEQPNPSGTTNVPSFDQVSAYIDFFPGTQSAPFPAGFAVEVPNLDHLDGTSGDTMVPLAPITGRLINGALCTIATGDPIGVQLLANTIILNLTDPLFYHTRFRNVTYGGALQAITNFSWQATDSTPVSGLTAIPHATGGSLATGTDWYTVTALLSGVETLACQAVSASVTGPSGSVTLNWSMFSGANGYNIYKGAASNALTTLLGTVSGVATTTFVDTGAAGTSVTAPSTDIVTITSPNLPQYPYAGP